MGVKVGGPQHSRIVCAGVILTSPVTAHCLLIRSGPEPEYSSTLLDYSFAILLSRVPTILELNEKQSARALYVGHLSANGKWDRIKPWGSMTRIAAAFESV